MEMGIAFLRTHYADKLEENPSKIEETVLGLLGNPNGRALISENGHGVEGMLGFVVFPHFFSGTMIAGELAWFVEPEARGRVGLSLLREAENAARTLGAKKMQMVSPDGRVAKLYKRLGYVEVETTYQRSLT